MSPGKNRWYAFRTQKKTGIVPTWEECERWVKGRKAAYRGFEDRESAERWLRTGELPQRQESDGQGKRHRFYAWRTDDGEGISGTWAECEREVSGRRARCRGFEDRQAASSWLEAGAPYEDRAKLKAEAMEAFPADTVFFDSGTGAGKGTEIRVTDRDGVPLTHLGRTDEGELTPEGNLLLDPGRTNNYGELLAFVAAVEAAESLGGKHVFGDSKLVIEYWSLGRVSRAKREDDPDLAALARRAAKARRRFEASAGRVGHVPGGLNPADLGYHRD